MMRFVTPTIAKSPLHSTTRQTAIFDMIYYKFNDVRNLWGVNLIIKLHIYASGVGLALR
jgi:hypothetical protein